MYAKVTSEMVACLAGPGTGQLLRWPSPPLCVVSNLASAEKKCSRPLDRFKTAHQSVFLLRFHVHAQVTMKSFFTGLTALATLSSSAHALYFYLDGTAPKCFYEELPKDTLVVG